MNITAINGSPRDNWNTAEMLKSFVAGAKSVNPDVDVNYVDLYKLNYTGCKSCFACKLANSETYGKCVAKDDLLPVLEAIATTDALVIGSPIYFGDITGMTRAFLERLLFPYISYGVGNPSLAPKSFPVVMIYTMNVTQEQAQTMGYDQHLLYTESTIGRILTTPKRICAFNTSQFSDYSKYVADGFSEPDKKKHHEEQFPKDLLAAYDMGTETAKSLIPEKALQYQKGVTKQLFNFFKKYGYWLVHVTNKSELPKDFTRLATVIFRAEKYTRPFIAKLIHSKGSHIEFELSETQEEQTVILNLCTTLKKLEWLTFSYDRKTRNLTINLEKNFNSSGRSFLNGKYGEYETLKRIESTLQEYAKEHGGFKYKLFHSVKIRKFDSAKQNDMELDVIAQLPDGGFYIFETKMGNTLGIDKWVDRARLFSQGKVRFITCGQDRNLNPAIFNPYTFLHLETLQEELAKLLEQDYSCTALADKNTAE